MQTTPPFTREALAILFERTNFQAFQKAGCPSHYWAPLLSACSGTSRNQIFFLTPQDVFQIFDIWAIRVNGNNTQNGGCGSSVLDIPVHPMLQRLGFLDFVRERRRTHPQERLFSEYKAIQEKAGVLFSRAFVNWIKTTVRQLPAEKMSLFKDDFHFPSLRALFSAEAIRCGIEENATRIIRQMGSPLGQSCEGSDERRGFESASAAIQKMNIEAYFPPLYSYEELMQ